MALCRTLIRTYAREYVHRPDLEFRAVNQRTCEDMRADTFVTRFYGVLHTPTGELGYCNAGHHPPRLLRHSGELESLALGSIPLGLFETIDLTMQCVHLHPGDSLVLYTDGLTDAWNPEGELFGIERVDAAIRSAAGKHAAVMRNSIFQSMSAFAGGGAPFDDVTLVVVRRDPTLSPSG